MVMWSQGYRTSVHIYVLPKGSQQVLHHMLITARACGKPGAYALQASHMNPQALFCTYTTQSYTTQPKASGPEAFATDGSFHTCT
jgi:hypothetical protein